ncbi:hypothetical protein [Roseibium aggregatum]|uniref:hypothetical protein n=1 Tax=Roseibium aggregatum TaxID=187304 RepID=UPI00094B0322|nr:hypothetical protein [Roseibium aggregatum]UFI06781.1 hypothetical protein ST40_029200 [Roseibium aggregatum]
MIKGFDIQRLAERAPVLIATSILLGMVPQVLRMSGINGFYICLTIFLLNLALCTVGLASGKFRLFWLLWAAASIASFILFGMATPVGVVLTLPIIV